MRGSLSCMLSIAMHTLWGGQLLFDEDCASLFVATCFICWPSVYLLALTQSTSLSLPITCFIRWHSVYSAGSVAGYVTVTTNETVTNSTWIDTTNGSALDVERSGLYIYGSNASTELVVDSGSEEVAMRG